MQLIEVPVQSHPEATNPASGPTVPWTSGLTGTQPATEKDPQQVCSLQNPGLRVLGNLPIHPAGASSTLPRRPFVGCSLLKKAPGTDSLATMLFSCTAGLISLIKSFEC